MERARPFTAASTAFPVTRQIAFPITRQVVSSLGYYSQVDSTNLQARRLVLSQPGSLPERVRHLFAATCGSVPPEFPAQDSSAQQALTGAQHALAGTAFSRPPKIPLALIVADEQTNGKGRLGRNWFAAPGESLTASFVTCLPAELVTGASASWLTILAGVALLEGCSEVLEGLEVLKRLGGVNDSLYPQLKWPNDLICGGGKVAGILTEVATIENADSVLIFGIGMNLFVPEIQLPTEFATSLHLHYANLPEFTELRDRILAATASRLYRYLHELIAHPRRTVEGLRKRALAHSYTLGRKVEVSLVSGETLTGTAVDILANGALAVRTASGEMREIKTGDVGVLPK